MNRAKSDFDDLELNTMTRAFEDACAELAVTREDKTRRERLAEMLFQVAQLGQFSETALVEEAVRRYRLAGSR